MEKWVEKLRWMKGDLRMKKSFGVKGTGFQVMSIPSNHTAKRFTVHNREHTELTQHFKPPWTPIFQPHLRNTAFRSDQHDTLGILPQFA
jgi:hypothetical protein